MTGISARGGFDVNERIQYDYSHNDLFLNKVAGGYAEFCFSYFVVNNYLAHRLP